MEAVDRSVSPDTEGTKRLRERLSWVWRTMKKSATLLLEFFS